MEIVLILILFGSLRFDKFLTPANSWSYCWYHVFNLGKIEVHV